MWRIKLTLLVLVCATKIVLVINETPLEVVKSSQFPIKEQSSFMLEIRPTQKSTTMTTLTNPKFDTMIIQISNNSGKGELQKYILDYGFKDMNDQESKGEYMRVPAWNRSQSVRGNGVEFDNSLGSESKDQGEDTESFVIFISIVFTRKARNHWLNVYQISASNNLDRRKKIFMPDTYGVLIYNAQIQLLTAPKIDLLIRTLDGRIGELMIDQPSIITCRSYDGFPPEPPMWVNLDEFNVVGAGSDGQNVAEKRETLTLRSKDRKANDRSLQMIGSYSQESNTREVQIIVTVADHLKELWCHAGKTKESKRIIVLHHPSQISLEPEIGTLLENGSTVLCIAIDGYPRPIVKWHFVSGPEEAETYFNISKDGTKLHMKSEAPLLSQWIFNCSAANRLPRSFEIFNRTVSFTIGSVQESLLGLSFTFQILVSLAMVGAIFISCIIIVFLVCVANNSCTNKNKSAPTKYKNGIPTKKVVDTKLKVLEPEQLILLAPAAAAIHMDVTNTGTGLPLPPMECQLMLDGDIKSNTPTDKENDLEVTYAELNTSDLPMKDSKGFGVEKPNMINEQVIYSQIIGTMTTTTPDCVPRGGYVDNDETCDAVTKDGKGFNMNNNDDDQVIYSQIIGTMTMGLQRGYIDTESV